VDTKRSTENEPNIEETLHSIRTLCLKRRWILLLSSMLTVLIGNFAVRLIPPKYRSEATILVADQQISPNYVTPLSNTPLLDRVQVAAREVLAQPRLLTIVEEFGLGHGAGGNAAVEELRKNIEIEPIPFSPSFRLSVTAGNPHLAQGIAQKLVDSFIERHREMETTRVENTTSMIQEQLAEGRRKLSALDQRIDAFKNSYAEALPEAMPQNLERWREARSRLDTATASLDRAKAQRAMLESTLIGNLNTRLTRLREEQSALLKKFTAKHPDVVSKDQQIAQLEAEIETLKTGGQIGRTRRDPIASDDPTIAQMEGQLEGNALEIETLTKEAARQNAIVQDFQRRLNSNPMREQQLNAMLRERLELSDEIGDLSRKQELSSMAADMAKRQQPDQFRVVDPPNLPTHPSSKKRQMASLGTLIAGPVIGIALAFLLQLRKPTFYAEAEIRRTFGPPMVLSIPNLPTPRETRNRRFRLALELAGAVAVLVLMATTEIFAYRILA
jgi:polysaccharide chain length determinant protein (PEP-CTERM system associated)